MSSKMSTATNALNWFEISVNDISRATAFYETIFDIQLMPMEMMGMKMAMFPADDANGKVGGSLVQSEIHHPSATGAIIYLNANPDLQLVIDRLAKTGSKVILPKTLIDENTGYLALFTDTEGNTIGLHSTK
ncbi:MAG: Glyoxalase/bleomycin resistance protein/dioxygenase [Chitinophagaceae bacterium]|nr:Glyoxalase/bleomycin resistance protein/dioxygenase [Chitinophagaceae bacterium]